MKKGTRYQKVDTAGSKLGTGWFPSINTEKTTGEDVIVFTDLVDDNEAGNFKKLDIKVKMLPDSIKFMPEETIFEGVKDYSWPAWKHGPDCKEDSNQSTIGVGY